MAQIEVPEQDIQKIDELVNRGVFLDRENAIKIILESFSELSEDEIKRMEKAKQIADMYLETYAGILLYAITPLKIVMDGREVYKIPVKTEAGPNSIFGYVYVDAQTMEIDIDLSTGLESLPSMSDEELSDIKKIQITADDHCKNHLDGMYAGAPRKIVVEDEEQFKIPVKGKHEGKTYIYGYLFIYPNTFAIEEVFLSKERSREIADQLTKYVGAIS